MAHDKFGRFTELGPESAMVEHNFASKIFRDTMINQGAEFGDTPYSRGQGVFNNTRHSGIKTTFENLKRKQSRFVTSLDAFLVTLVEARQPPDGLGGVPPQRRRKLRVDGGSPGPSQTCTRDTDPNPLPSF